MNEIEYLDKLILQHKDLDILHEQTLNDYKKLVALSNKSQKKLNTNKNGSIR